MNKKDSIEFGEVMITNATIYEKTVNEQFVNIYFDILKEYSISEIKQAFAQHIKTIKFFPKPSEIIEILTHKVNIENKAEEAWLKLREAIREHGYYDSVQFDDPVIHTCIRAMGGWLKVSDREQDTWMHKDFVNFYKAYHDKEVHPEITRGFIEGVGGRYNTGRIGEFLKNIKAINEENAIGIPF